MDNEVSDKINNRLFGVGRKDAEEKGGDDVKED